MEDPIITEDGSAYEAIAKLAREIAAASQLETDVKDVVASQENKQEVVTSDFKHEVVATDPKNEVVASHEHKQEVVASLEQKNKVVASDLQHEVVTTQEYNNEFVDSGYMEEVNSEYTQEFVNSEYTQEFLTCEYVHEVVHLAHVDASTTAKVITNQEQVANLTHEDANAGAMLPTDPRQPVVYDDLEMLQGEQAQDVQGADGQVIDGHHGGPAAQNDILKQCWDAINAEGLFDGTNI